MLRDYGRQNGQCNPRVRAGDAVFCLASSFLSSTAGCFAFSYVSLTNAVREGAVARRSAGRKQRSARGYDDLRGGTGSPPCHARVHRPSPAVIGGSVTFTRRTKPTSGKRPSPRPGMRLEHAYTKSATMRIGDQHGGEGDMLAKLHTATLAASIARKSQSIVTLH